MFERQFSENQKTTFYCAPKQKIGSVVEDKRHTNKGQPHTLILEDDDIIDQTVQLFQKKKKKIQKIQKFNVRVTKNSC